jgi:hypothetical protein
MTKSIYSASEINILQHMAENGDLSAKKMLDEEMERVLHENALETKADWLERNGFNKDQNTYIVIGETYSIKSQLKADGFIYNPILKWHRSNPDGYEDKVIKINIAEVASFVSWGVGTYYPEAQSYIENKLAEAASGSSQDWVAAQGDKISDTLVTLISRSSFINKWGKNTFIYNFKDKNNYRYTYFTNKILPQDINETLIIHSAIVKEQSNYKGIKSVIISNMKIKEINAS